MPSGTHSSGARGFTLIEMLVSVALFAIVMAVSATSLISVVQANRKAEAVSTAMSNLNFALDTISRSIRMGSNYRCDTTRSETPVDCASGGTAITFEEHDGEFGDPSDQTTFQLNGSHLEWRYKGGPTFQQMTADDISISSFKVYVTGSSLTDNAQPMVRIVMTGTVGTDPRTKSTFSIETAATQRLLDRDL